MFKKFLEFGAGILVGTCLAKSSIIFGMAVEKTKKELKDRDEAKTETKKES